MNAALQSVDASWFETAERCWCGGRAVEPSPFSSDYRICPRCGAHYARRRLRPDCIGKFYSYEGYWQHRQQDKQHPTLFERQPLLEADGRVACWFATLARHTGGRPGTVVEVGCAEGTLLQRLRQAGWTTIGIEPDDRTAAAVRTKTRLDIRAGVFPALPAPPCDLFVACDVLEHVPEPREFLEAAREALRPGGVLFLQLPLLEGTPADFGEMNAKVFDPEEHVFVHSRASLATLLEAAGFDVLENDSAWRRAHEFAVARRPTRPARKVRHLANLPEMFSRPWIDFIDELNAFAAPHGLRQFTNWSKLWEYPWLWHHGFNCLDWRGLRLLDIGSEQSPFPWWLATKGARVTLVETESNWIGQWETVRAALGGVAVDWRIVDSCRLPFPRNSIDVVTSFSVLEHQKDKSLAAAEVARVLRPGGRFGLSFDICEPSLGMTFPDWNGRALTMREFEEWIWNRPEFGRHPRPRWNIEDIPPFLRWHRRTAPHHNYVTAAAILLKPAVSGWWRRLFSRT